MEGGIMNLHHFRIKLAKWIMPDTTLELRSCVQEQKIGWNFGLINDNTPIDQIAHLLATRTVTCLREWSNIRTLGDLSGKNTEELMKIKNFGKMSMTDIRFLWPLIGLKIPKRHPGTQPARGALGHTVSLGS